MADKFQRIAALSRIICLFIHIFLETKIEDGSEYIRKLPFHLFLIVSLPRNSENVCIFTHMIERPLLSEYLRTILLVLLIYI